MYHRMEVEVHSGALLRLCKATQQIRAEAHTQGSSSLLELGTFFFFWYMGRNNINSKLTDKG